MKTILLDAGHGGIKDGKYVTAPKKMHHHEVEIAPDRHYAYEGEINRAIAEYAKKEFQRRGWNVIKIYDEVEDWPLKKRLEIANKFNPDHSVLVSIHSNASNTHLATGNEVFVHPEAGLLSRKIADDMGRRLKKIPLPLRSNIGHYKEANFKMLRESKMPAVLVECGFFDQHKNATMLYDKFWQQKYAEYIAF